MAQLHFQHPAIAKDLIVDTGMNEISWTYNLTTQAFPTFAGEVIQVLSANISDLSIMGEVRTYTEMEDIYKWFLEYMTKATQTGQNEAPVMMAYPRRDWLIGIKPMTLPQMQYAREVVVPQWRMTAAVIHPDTDQMDLSLDYAVGELSQQDIVEGEIANFRKRIDSGIGYRIKNPFSDPYGALYQSEVDAYYGGNLEAEGAEGMTVVAPDEKIDKLMERASSQGGEKRVKYVGKQMQDMFKRLITDGGIEDITGNLDAWIGGNASKPAGSTRNTTTEQNG